MHRWLVRIGNLPIGSLLYPIVEKGIRCLRNSCSCIAVGEKQSFNDGLLQVRNAPKGAQVSLSCTKCALKKTKKLTVARDLQPLRLKQYLGTAKLKKGASVKVVVTAVGLVGRTYTYKVVRYGEFPAPSIVCSDPGAKEGRPC